MRSAESREKAAYRLACANVPEMDVDGGEGFRVYSADMGLSKRVLGCYGLPES